MRPLVSILSLTLSTLLFALPAFAGNWGENWGSMVWGAVAAVPSMGWLGGGLLVGLIAGVGLRRKWGRGGSALALLLVLANAPVAEAQVISAPNHFTNGTVADADAMNANFETLQLGVNAALTSGSVTLPHTFLNNTVADADEVNANFTALETGVNTALANRAADCMAVGGVWDAVASTCTVSTSYNCFLGGFCAIAASDFSPTVNGYPNAYEGHSQGAGAALTAGCNVGGPRSQEWELGVNFYSDCSDPLSPYYNCQAQLLTGMCQ